MAAKNPVRASRRPPGEMGVLSEEHRVKRQDPSKYPIDKPLTELQRKIVDLLAVGNNVTSVAERLDTYPATVYGYLRYPNIKHALALARAKYEQASQMTRKRVMDGLLEAIDMAKLMAEPATMVSGWREIAKMCGYMEPVKRRVEINVTGSVMLDKMNQLSDAELLKVISQGAAPALETIVHEIEDAQIAEVEAEDAAEDAQHAQRLEILPQDPPEALE